MRSALRSPANNLSTRTFLGSAILGTAVYEIGPVPIEPRFERFGYWNVSRSEIRYPNSLRQTLTHHASHIAMKVTDAACQ
jgi:hypothetical protein